MPYFPKTLLWQDILDILARDAASVRGDGFGNLPPMAIAALLSHGNDAGRISMDEAEYLLRPMLDWRAGVGLLGFVDHGPNLPREYLSREASLAAISNRIMVTLRPLAEGFTVPQPPCEVRDEPPSPTRGEDDGSDLRP